MKKPTLWLRLASIVTFLFALGHTVGFSAPSADATEQAARHAMQTMPFDLAGKNVNYWGLYLGFGYSIGLFLVLQSVLLWLMAGAARRSEKISDASIIAFLVCNVINMALLLKYFFIVPQLMEGAIILFLAMALFTRRGLAPAAG